MTDVAASILDELQQPEARVLPLLQRYHVEEFRPAWHSDPRLYRAFGQALISAGQSTMAFELLREALTHHEQDCDLLFLRALALTRGRNLIKAEEYVQELLKREDLEQRLRVQALSLAGRLKKDRMRTSGPASRARLAAESAALYEQAANLEFGSFPAINAATMSLLAGRPDADILRMAQTAMDRAAQERALPGRRDDYWLLATLGEGHLLLNNMQQAENLYRQAVAQAAGRIGDIASIRRQVQLLHECRPLPKEILDLFAVGTVVAFVGHMFDPPWQPRGAAGPRFPPDPGLEKRVREAIRAELDRLDPAVGYCSAACGSDLLFAELMLERQKELNLVLPYARSDFYKTSVDFGLPQMQEYRRRFDAVAERAQLHYGTEEGFLGHHDLLAHAGAISQGLAVLRAEELAVEPWALAVVDPHSIAHGGGGVRSFLDRWDGQGRRTRTIDLAVLRGEPPPPLPDWWTAPVPQATGPAVGTSRRVQVMLFADVKNYSSLSEEQAPSFFLSFLSEVIQVIQATRNCPTLCNTWGDGLFLVFDRVRDGADFALRLLERIEATDWTTVGLPPDTTVRIGVHAGPVYPHWDQLIGRLNFFGTHVNRAARIEPKTPPGCVYASEQLAALLALERDLDFVCEYVGVHLLGKEHDQFRCPLYRLRRKEEGA